MSVNVTMNGVTHTIPENNELDWGTAVTDYLVAISSSTLQKSGGTFTLTSDVNFGATNGLKSLHYTTYTSTPSTAGVLRLANADSIGWRNSGNTNNVLLGVGSTDGLLAVDGVDLVTTSGTQTLTNKTINGGTLSGSITLSGTISGVQAQDNGLDSLAALGTTGIVVQSVADTFITRTLTASALDSELGIIITNGTGISGNPTVGVKITSLSAIGSLNDPTNDTMMINDDSAVIGGANRKITVANLASYVGGSMTLNSLSDTTIAGPTTGDLLSFTGSVWEDKSYSELSISRYNTSETRSAAINMADNVVQSPEIKDYSITHTSASSSGGGVTFNYAAAQSFNITLTENITSVTINNPPASGKFGEIRIRVTQGASAYTMTGFPTTKWINGTSYVPTTLAGYVDIISLQTEDGGTTWYGSYSKGYV